jgi:hypothetical protein
LALRKAYPIVDQVEFRRIFGQNEIISSWSWPDKNSAIAVLQTLADRKWRLEDDVNLAQKNAEKLAGNVEKFATLKRESTVAEATYTVMIEQVKANSIMAGFNSNKSEVYEYAVTPISPSAPRRNLVIMIGGVLGLFLGSCIALIFSYWRGVYYSTRALLSVQKFSYNAKTKNLRRVSKKTFDELSVLFHSRPIASLRDIKLQINQSKKQYVIISGLGSKLKAKNLSNMLCADMQSDGLTSAYINFSRFSKTQDNIESSQEKSNFIVLEKFKGLTVLAPPETTRALNFITRQGAKDSIKNLCTEFDRIILSIEAKDAISLARFLNPNDVFHIALTRKNKTKRELLEKISSIMPLGAHFYD